jgi:hypothetical protein
VGWARLQLFGVDPAETGFAQRGFAATTPDRRDRLEQAGRHFAAGYNAAIRGADADLVLSDLNAVPLEQRGFAFEGAGMGFALLDLLAPWRSRHFARFLAGAAGPHVYIAHVGAGWALARTSPRLAWRLGPLDPLLGWLAFDGYGFHAGYFHPHRAIDRQRRPRGLRGVARHVYDQGLGRSIWFARGADPAAVSATVAAFAPERRADVWSGVGLAAAYAGGADPADLADLAAAAGSWRPDLGQGAAFAAKARARAGNPAAHTQLACSTFCGMDAARAASLTDAALPAPRADDDGASFMLWRRRIRDLLAAYADGPFP